jgi:glycosyltransferase involved in cell wall biosynthesis
MNAIGSLFDEMDLLIVNGRPRAGGLPLPSFANVVPLREPKGKDLWRKFFVAASLPYYLRTMYRYARQADVVHVPLPGDLAFLGMLVALALRKPLIARYGGAWSANTQTTLMNRVTRAIMRAAAGGENVMLATGEGDTHPAPGVRWLFSTALSDQEIESIRPDLNRGLQQPPSFIYAGRLSEEKGVHILIEAVASLKRKHGIRPQVTLLGDGPQRGYLEELVKRLDVGSQVVFRGQVGRRELGESFEAADVAVQPSLTESFGKAWIDAMAYGVPVVTCYVGSAERAVGGQGNRGWLVPPNDSRALADKLHGVVTQAIEWPEIRRRCRKYAETLTLENWKRRIGEICAGAWGCRFENGKLLK